VPVTGQTPSSNTPSATPGLPPKAVLDAQQWLAAQLNLAVEQVKITAVEQAEWTDSCLGLGRLNESCAQVITPGWRVVFEINGQPYEVRTDETGSTIRLASPGGFPSGEAFLENTHWSLVSFGPAGAENSLTEGSMITLILVDGQAGGFGGCNAYSATYQVEGGSLSFDEITSTLRACTDEQITEQEQQYFEALKTAGSYVLEGNQLRITYSDGVLVFETPFPTVPVPTVETPVG
jgi:heat shock protein HslJ